MRGKPLAFAWLALAAAAAAQPVYRCGNSYGQQPCPGGTVLAPPPTPSSPHAATQARALALRDARLAEQMGRERLAREQQAPKAIVIGAQPPAPAPPLAKQAVPKPKGKDKEKKQPEHFTAVGPKPAKK